MEARGNDIKINLNATTICYDDYGNGTVPIIFIHGFPFDKSSWKPQIEFLKIKYRVIAYDIRGFGKSLSGTEKISISLFADDLVKFMDILGIKKAVVCGLSMGGYILLNAISRYPERFEGVILSDTQCIADSPEAKEKRKQTISHILASGIQDFADGFVKNIFCNDSLETKKEMVDQIKNIILSTSIETITGTLSALADRSDTCTILNEIKVPALILCGSEDIITPPVQSEYLQSRIVNSKINIIEKAGHMSNLEQSAKFNEHIDAFLPGRTV